MLQVDFDNPTSILEAFSVVEERLGLIKVNRDDAIRQRDAAQARIEQTERDGQTWLALHNALRLAAEAHGISVVDEEPVDEELTGVAATDSKVAVLNVVDSEIVAWSVADVAGHLPNFARKTVAWALWKLSEEGMIQKVGRGVYAPHDYKMEELTPTLNGRSSTQDAVQRDPAERTGETPAGAR